MRVRARECVCRALPLRANGVCAARRGKAALAGAAAPRRFPLQGSCEPATSQTQGAARKAGRAARGQGAPSLRTHLAEPSASSGSSPRVTRHCRAGDSPLQDQVRLSVVSTGTATVSTGTCAHGHAAQPGSSCAAHDKRKCNRQGEQAHAGGGAQRGGKGLPTSGRYLATSRAVEPPRVSTTMRDACTCGQSARGVIRSRQEAFQRAQFNPIAGPRAAATTFFFAVTSQRGRRRKLQPRAGGAGRGKVARAGMHA